MSRRDGSKRCSTVTTILTSASAAHCRLEKRVARGRAAAGESEGGEESVDVHVFMYIYRYHIDPYTRLTHGPGQRKLSGNDVCAKRGFKAAIAE